MITPIPDYSTMTKTNSEKRDRQIKKERGNGGAVAVAHLAERSLPTTGDPGSNPFMSNFVKEHLFYVTCTEKI